MLRRPAALFILLFLSAGCLSPSAPSATTNASVVGAAAPLANRTVDAPTWKVGDAWIATSDNRGQTENLAFVVTSAGSDAYILSTTSPTLALFDAQFDISYVGKIRADDLAGAQGSTAVAFFSFPLKDGKTWTATWDGRAVTLTAKAQSDGSFAIVGMDGDKPYVSYDYVPALKWWSHIEFGQQYKLKINRLQENWTGDYRVATVKKLLSSTTVAPVVTFNNEAFSVDQGQTNLFATLTGGASAYAREFRFIDPTGQPHTTNSTADDAQPTGGNVTVTENLPPIAGGWRVEAPIAHAPGGSFALVITEARVETRRLG